MEHPFPKIRL